MMRWEISWLCKRLPDPHLEGFGRVYAFVNKLSASMKTFDGISLSSSGFYEVQRTLECMKGILMIGDRGLEILNWWLLKGYVFKCSESDQNSFVHAISIRSSFQWSILKTIIEKIFSPSRSECSTSLFIQSSTCVSTIHNANVFLLWWLCNSNDNKCQQMPFAAATRKAIDDSLNWNPNRHVI